MVNATTIILIFLLILITFIVWQIISQIMSRIIEKSHIESNMIIAEIRARELERKEMEVREKYNGKFFQNNCDASI